jgi:hypothetical protein
VDAYDAHPAPERLLLRKETFVVQPSSADTRSVHWRYGDAVLLAGPRVAIDGAWKPSVMFLKPSFEAERNSLEAFTSARTLAGKATKLEVLPEADAMHTLLESPGAHEFDGCTESSPEEAEYISLVEAIEAYKQR